MGAWLALVLLIISSIIMVIRPSIGTIAGYDPGFVAALTAASALLVYFLFSLLGHFKTQMAGTAQQIIVGSLLACLIFFAYLNRSEILFMAQNMGAKIQYFGAQVSTGIQKTFPAPANEVNGTIVRIRKRSDGHFVAMTQVNDKTLNMIVDTGATTVVLRQEDAVAVGINVAQLQYTTQVKTANGIAYAAKITIKNIEVGPLKAENIDAFVVKPGTLQQSLLGMSFLSLLRSYEFTGDYLSLRG